jgi:type III secretory pathway component EscU
LNFCLIQTINQSDMPFQRVIPNVFHLTIIERIFAQIIFSVKKMVNFNKNCFRVAIFSRCCVSKKYTHKVVFIPLCHLTRETVHWIFNEDLKSLNMSEDNALSYSCINFKEKIRSRSTEEMTNRKTTAS